MDSKGNEGDVERRRSSRMSAADNWEEELDLALAGMVTDGFRPPHLASTPESSTQPTARIPPVASPADGNSASPSGQDAEPPVAAKPQVGQREPGEPRRQSTSSSASTGFIPVDPGPYQGPTGPSHPYQLYSQNVRSARTLSMATSSTVPMSESSYHGPRAPTHPYGLYPQSDGIDSAAVQPAAIPLGFRGLPDQYQRRIGPDGEEIGDMIGPDGHTEQLPPYTRYPDEAYMRKATVVEGSTPAVVQGAAAVATPALITTAPTVDNVPGAGGLGLATRNPEFESTEDLGSPDSRHSARSFTSDDSQRGIRADDEHMSEKRGRPRKWQAWMRRKLWGIVPYWAICLAGSVLLVMAIVLGAVIGGTSAKPKRPPRKDGVWNGFNMTIPIETPPDLRPLATGTFFLPIIPNFMSNTCFRDPTLSQAWSCHIANSGIFLTILKDGEDYRASLNCNRSTTLLNNVYMYGEQPPLIEDPVTLELVRDKFEPNRGPAWFKMVRYNKTVILPAHALGSSEGGSNEAPGVASISAGGSNLTRKDAAERGDKPWICSWPNTYLELFIYAQQNSSYSNWSDPSASSLSSTADSSAPTDSSATASSSNQLSTLSDEESDSLPGDPTPPSEPPKTVPSDTTSTPKHKYQHYAPRSPPLPTPAPSHPTIITTTTTTTESSPTRPPIGTPMTGPFWPIDTGDGPPSLPLSPYPRVIKVAERRVSTRGAPRARCTQVEVRGPGEEARVVRRADGRAVVVNIDETEPYVPGGGKEKRRDGARRSLWIGGEAGLVFAREDGEGGGDGEDDEDSGGSGGGGGGGAGAGVPELGSCACLWFAT